MSKSCEMHLVPNCPLCAKKPAPATPPPAVPAPPVQKLDNPPATPATSTPVVPIISDPHASKVLAAANKYAAACDAFNTAALEVKKLMSQLSDAKTREADALTLRDAAQTELTKIMGEKS